MSSAANKTKGVAICFANHINLSQPETVIDPMGRYILVSGNIDGELYTFVSYYAPNKGQKTFFDSLLHKLQPHLKGTIFMGGESNIAFDVSLDKSGRGEAKPRRPSGQSVRIAKLLHDTGLIDIWRETNPHSKDYTYFSAHHNSFARIDHICTRPTTIPFIKGIKIVDTPLSDHSNGHFNHTKDYRVQRSPALAAARIYFKRSNRMLHTRRGH